MQFIRFLVPGLAAFTVIASLACGANASTPATTAATSIPTAPPTIAAAATPQTAGPATPQPAAVADDPAGPGPIPGEPCPVEPDVCEFAVLVTSLIEAGDGDALFALGSAVPGRCPAAGRFGGFGGPTIELCAGAAEGDIAYGYWVVQAGEGVLDTQSSFLNRIRFWLDASTSALVGPDSYGPGAARVGSIACTRAVDAPPGTCDGNWIDLNVTLILAESAPPGSGAPGHRATFFLRTRREGDGTLVINGIGNSVPPNAILQSLLLNAATDSGEQVLLESYPWTP